jgi:small subunit ribosomal protein S18
MMRKKLSRIIKRQKINDKCPYCGTKTNPDFKDSEPLRKYLTERGKIIGSEFSGLCASHQRKLTKEIKKARYLALLPFINQIR